MRSPSQSLAKMESTRTCTGEYKHDNRILHKHGFKTTLKDFPFSVFLAAGKN